jgi:hypothetical protein
MLDRAWEEDELSPYLHFPLDLWGNICTYFKNKRLISLTTYFKIYSDYYLITTVTCTYQKLSASESALVTRSSSHSRIFCLSVTHFDF